MSEITLKGSNKEYGFKQLEKVGTGGEGEVFKVEDTESGRIYALKRPKNNNFSLLEEINTLQKVRHPNITDMYDASVGDKDNKGFILMQYMEHGNITDYIKKNSSISVYRKLLFIKQIAEALQYLHNKDCIHRDIKPSNILITSDKGNSYACLGDFGIAKDLSRDTETGGGKGTWLYLPPEVCQDDEECKKADIYALGMSMYEILTGNHPYKGYSYINYIQEANKCSSIKEPSSYDLSLNGKVNQICQKSVAKSKELRYNSIREFLNDLEMCMETYQKLDCTLEFSNKKEVVSDIDLAKNKSLLYNNVGVKCSEIISIDKESEKIDNLKKKSKKDFLAGFMLCLGIMALGNFYMNYYKLKEKIDTKTKKNIELEEKIKLEIQEKIEVIDLLRNKNEGLEERIKSLEDMKREVRKSYEKQGRELEKKQKKIKENLLKEIYKFEGIQFSNKKWDEEINEYTKYMREKIEKSNLNESEKKEVIKKMREARYDKIFNKAVDIASPKKNSLNEEELYYKLLKIQDQEVGHDIDIYEKMRYDFKLYSFYGEAKIVYKASKIEMHMSVYRNSIQEMFRAKIVYPKKFDEKKINKEKIKEIKSEDYYSNYHDGERVKYEFNEFVQESRAILSNKYRKRES